MKVSVFSPVKNEVDFIGYSVMSVLPYVHEILYGIAKSDDGTEELLTHIQHHYAPEKLRLFWGSGANEPQWDFDPMNMEAYNASYNYLIEKATGDAVWFLHPDMIVTNPHVIPKIDDNFLAPLAWWTNIRSFAKDLNTEIVVGRSSRWKNIHLKDFGLHYYGGYGSQNEDMYFRDITGDTYHHYGEDFASYPFEVADSGIRVNHYCELKGYKRRLEKMERCIQTLMPKAGPRTIQELASQHPRVTLEEGASRFGRFAFAPTTLPIPDVFEKYREEFSAFKKETVHA